MTHITEKLKEFDKIFYEGDDALFDRSGNNVSRQVTDFIRSALQSQQEEMVNLIAGEIGYLQMSKELHEKELEFARKLIQIIKEL